MLKITKQTESGNLVRVNLHGGLTGEYVPLVEKALSENGCQNGKVALDLVNVTFVDREAMGFLRRAIFGRKIAIENLPSYVKRWIEQEIRDSTNHHHGITSADPETGSNDPEIPLFTAFSFRSSV